MKASFKLMNMGVLDDGGQELNSGSWNHWLLGS
jgi:hypothetical protein